MTTTAPTPMALHQWRAFVANRPETERWELVRGNLAMAPHEHPRNLSATALLAHHLMLNLGTNWIALQDAPTLLAGGPTPTLRGPDLVVVPRGPALDAYPLAGETVELITETLSPSTRAVDLHDKRLEYAAAGIPSYLIIDLANKRTPLTLLTDPRAGDYRTATAGLEVTLYIDGTAIVISAETLRA